MPTSSPIGDSITAQELGKQLDVVQPFGELVLPCAAGLCLRVNDHQIGQ